MSESDIRNLNPVEQSIYRIIYKHGPVSKNEIASHADVSLATVSRVINTLEKKNVVAPLNKEEAGGRVALKYKVDDKQHVLFSGFICFEVCGIGLCDINGGICELETIPMRPDKNPNEIIEFFNTFIQRTLREHHLSKSDVLGFGLGVLGPILKDKGIIYNPYHLDSSVWNNTPIKDLVEMKTGITTFIDNLAEIALLGELYPKIKESTGNVAYLWMDRGIGCAVYSNGAIGFGSIDVSSNIGHMVIDFKGEQCVCGKRGCLETYASIESMYRHLEKRISVFPALTAEEAEYCSNNVWRCCPELVQIGRVLENPNREVTAFIEELEDAVTSSLINFIQLFNANTIYYAGRTPEQLPAVIERAFNRILEEASADFYRDVNLIKSVVNTELLIEGGCFLVVNKYLKLIHQS
jgi:predicted NBD/HSP70 family sugar kinase